MSWEFEWPLAHEFINRKEELGRLEDWWASSQRKPINLYGRRRVGKSWLFRKFAHGKPSIIFVAHKVAPGMQLAAFAERLEPLLGVKPDLPDLQSLFRALFRIARDRKILVIIDEFPWLLPTGENAIERELTGLQAVFEEERDNSNIKLILCGSTVRQMESLMSERNPLHGRLIAFHLKAMSFGHAQEFLKSLPPLQQIERFAITGGMPLYLSELGSGELKTVICRELLNRHGLLWDEARAVLDQELRESKVYFSILEKLASGDKEINEIGTALRINSAPLSKYLHTLESLAIISRSTPISDRQSRSGKWHLNDPLFRFWFRYVFPYQDELESGLKSQDLYNQVVSRTLSDHVSPAFEEWCQQWTLETYGDVAQKVGRWWGKSLHVLRRSNERQSEEIDIVGIGQNRVSIVGECKWQTKKLDARVLWDLDNYKIPALQQDGLKLAPDMKILLFSRSGYSSALVDAAAQRDDLILVDVERQITRTQFESGLLGGMTYVDTLHNATE